MSGRSGANIVAACLAKRVGQPSPMILAGYTKSGHTKPALNAALLAIVDPPDATSQFRVACPLGKKYVIYLSLIFVLFVSRSRFRNGSFVADRDERVSARILTNTFSSAPSNRPFMIAVQSDDAGSDLCAVCIVSGRRIENIGAVYSCLEEMKERYGMMVSDDGDAHERLISDDTEQLSKDINSLVVKYNDPNAQVVAKLKGQMKDLQASLSSAIAVLMLRGDKLNELLDNAEKLAEKSGELRDHARSVYIMMLWRYWKWILMIIVGLAIFIGIIVAIACASNGCN